VNTLPQLPLSESTWSNLVLTFSLGWTSNEFALVITPPYLPC
jgi:hypothetical protein